MKLSQFNKYLYVNDERILVVNTLKRSISELDNDLYRKLKSCTSNDLISQDFSKKSIQELQRAGIIINNRQNELSTFNSWIKSFQSDFTTIKAVVLLTFKCNLNCSYCFENGPLKEQGQIMTKEISERLIDWIKLFAYQKKSRHINLYFYGGEPTINYSELEKITTALKYWAKTNKIDLGFYMFTNGTNLTPKILNIINNANFRMIQIALDGPPDINDSRRPFKNGKGSFKVIYKNIEQILSITNIKVRVIVNYDKENYEYIPLMLNIFDHLKKSNLEFAFNPVFVTKYNLSVCKPFSISGKLSAAIWADLYKETIKRGFYCNPLRIFDTGPCTFWRISHLIFGPLGDIYKCIGMPGRKDFQLGNVFHDNIDNIIERLSEMFKKVIPWNNERCLKCVYLPLCLGGCRFHSLEQDNKISEVYCHKELIERCEMNLIKHIYSYN